MPDPPSRSTTHCDVQVFGAGLVGCAIARGLAAEGVDVRLCDAGRGPWRPSGGVVLGFHPEHPWRLEAALGPRRAGELVAFLRDSVGRVPGLKRCGVEWRAKGVEVSDVAPSVAAARRIGLRVEEVEGGFVLLDGGEADGAVLDAALAFPLSADPVPAEIEVLATGTGDLDPWLADKVTPVRWQSAVFEGPALPRPVASRHASVFAFGALTLSGARWATPHLEVGEVDPVPTARVSAALCRVAAQDHGVSSLPVKERAGIVAESCDGLPIVGPIPGRPRVVVAVGLGVVGLTYGFAIASAVVDGILGRPGVDVPSFLRASRLA